MHQGSLGWLRAKGTFAQRADPQRGFLSQLCGLQWSRGNFRQLEICPQPRYQNRPVFATGWAGSVMGLRERRGPRTVTRARLSPGLQGLPDLPGRTAQLPPLWLGEGAGEGEPAVALPGNPGLSPSHRPERVHRRLAGRVGKESSEQALHSIQAINQHRCGPCRALAGEACGHLRRNNAPPR